MNKLLLTFFVVFAINMAYGEITPRFPSSFPQPVIVNTDPLIGSDLISGSVLPCDTDYWRINTFENVLPWQYLRIEYNQTLDNDHPGDRGRMYVIRSEYEDLQTELESNENIINTLGELPGENNFDYLCDEDCVIELNCEFMDGTYYLGFTGGVEAIVSYNFRLFRGEVDPAVGGPVALQSGLQNPEFEALRPTTAEEARVLNYKFYSIDVTEFSEGTYLDVSISRASTQDLVLRLNHESLPVAWADRGVLDAVDNVGGPCVWDMCVDTNRTTSDDEITYDGPINTDPRIPCECTPFREAVGNIGVQLTCGLVVDPCTFEYGTWYISVELPDTTTPAQYTILAFVVQPVVPSLIRNVTFKGFVEPERQTHYKIDVPRGNDFVEGETHFMVHVSNVRNGFVDIWVHQGLGQGKNLAGGPEACVPANVTCHTSDACNVIVEKCYFQPGTWYISLSVGEDESGYMVEDFDRLPITYTIRANWLRDAEPTQLLAGVPVNKFIGEALYDFYVIEVPPTIDTWLYVELYAQQEDTEVILSMLHGDLPGGDCYARPDFYCLTGDPRDITINSGPPQNLVNTPVSREACTFMIQTCELEAGPLFLSVYGHHVGYSAYGDNTYYQVPVHYTLYVDFDVALSLSSGVAYSEHVFEQQYQHYYIRADNIKEGSSLSVEVTNIQHGIPQTLEAFINYNFLAGNCPCYDHLYNCTGATLPGCNGVVPDQEPNFLPDEDIVATCCTMVVPACDFRSGVWYVSVLGVNEDRVQYTTPIGYTLTVTVHDAPVINPLMLHQTTHNTVPQWNRTMEYTHYKLAASPLPNHNLFIQMTYVQNCEYQEKHDNLRDQLNLFVKRNGVAGQECWDWTCTANIMGHSYCSVVIPACSFEDGDYFVAIQGDYDAVFEGRFTLEAHLEEIKDTPLSSGVSVYGSVDEYQYQHYYYELLADSSLSPEESYLLIDLYTNSDQDSVTVYVNHDERAGGSPCYEWTNRCETESSCQWKINGCDLTAGRYYISVYGSEHQFYDISVEYTLTVTQRRIYENINNGDPITGHIQVDQQYHYRMDLRNYNLVTEGDYLLVEVENVKHGVVEAYINYDDLAGRCPCHKNINPIICRADSDNTASSPNWCEIRIPSCELIDGFWYFSVVGVENKTPDPIPQTPIGFTLEVNVIRGNVIQSDQLTVVDGRFDDNVLSLQSLANGRYNHYEIDIDDEDFDEGAHVIVEITNVRDGALFVYFNTDEPGDEAGNCHIANLCSVNGLGAGTECHWQIPYCLTKSGTHFISVEGVTGRVQVSYDILVYLQTPLTVSSTPNFIYEERNNDLNSGLNITHYISHEPNNWAQFIELTNVSPLDVSNQGEALEIYFYNIRNVAGEPMSFNVYAWPESPAGASECCTDDDASATDIGNCLGAPCLRTVPLTASSSQNGISSVDPHLCSFGNGIGNEFDDDDTSRFERCTVTIWPCDLAELHQVNTESWYITVIPVSANTPNVGDNDNGLQYNVEWASRTIRIAETTDDFVLGTNNLNEFINQDTTPTFTVTNYNIDHYNYGSFSFDVSNLDNLNKRISVQTNFISGSGNVYINTPTFASPYCNEYQCGTGSTIDCNAGGRYIEPACCFDGTTTYITVENTANPFFDSVNNVTTSTVVEFSFRIIVNDESEVEDQVVPFTASGNPSGISFPASGVKFENYQFYRFEIQDSTLLNLQSLLVNFTKVNNFNNETLTMYLRYGIRGGDFFGNSNDFYDLPEGCYNTKWQCTVTGDEVCYLEVPPCALRGGSWYLSVFNPDFDFTGLPNEFVDFNLDVSFSDSPQQLILGNSVSGSLNGVVNNYYHYQLDLTSADLDLNSNDLNNNYYINYLQVALRNVTGSGNVSLYGSYEVLAGDRNDFNCYNDYYELLDCDTTDCTISIFPCTGELRTATYFFSINVFSSLLESTTSADWDIVATIEQEVYNVINPIALSGTGHRAGTLSNYYTYTTELNDGIFDPNGSTDYFAFTVSSFDSEVVGDALPNDEYIIFNITNHDNSAIGEGLFLNVWRDDCERWTCSVNSLDGWCVIDATGLAPCTSRGGNYFMEVDNPSGLNYTVSAYHNQTVIQDILNQQHFVDIIYPNEYAHYYFEPNNVQEISSLIFNVETHCGNVEAWIQPDVGSGPGPDSSGDFNSCALDHCLTNGFYYDDDNNTIEDVNQDRYCFLYLDTCVFEQRGYYITIRGVDQEFPASNNPNLYLPITFEIEPVVVNINQLQFSGLHCAKTIGYVANTDINLPFEPQQYYFDIETANVGASMLISMRVPSNVYDATGTGVASLTMMKNRPVGSTVCDNYPTTCSILQSNPSQMSCSFEVNECGAVSTGRYYLWADAPRGSEVLVEMFDPTIPLLVADRVYSSTINGPAGAGDFNLPYRPNRQFYRIDVEPDNTDFYMRVHVWNVEHGTLSVIVNSGYYPSYNDENGDSYCSPGDDNYLNDVSCIAVDNENECLIEISRCEVHDSSVIDANRERTFWITVEGTQQLCDLHSIQYDLAVQVTADDVVTLPVGSQECYSVEEGEHAFFRLSPRSVSRPQQTVLNFRIVDVANEDGEEVGLYIHDNNGALATVDCFDEFIRTGIDGQLDYQYTAGYDELFVSVYGISADLTKDSNIEFCLSVEREFVRVVSLADGVVHFEDDDDVDVCDHDHDYYYFNINDNDDDGDHFIVEIRSEAPVEAYINSVHFANESPLNHMDYCVGSQDFALSGDDTYYCTLVDICDFNERDYYVTVKSEGKYTIGAAHVNNLIELENNIGLEGAVGILDFDTFYIDVTSDMIADSSTRLIGEIADVRHGAVIVLVNRGSMAGLAFKADGSVDTCFEDGVGVSGEDVQESFVVIDPCDLRPGRYYFTVYGVYNDANFDDFQNCKETRYRLTVSLETLNIPVQSISSSVPTSDSLYFYSIDRLENPEVRFYTVPLSGGDSSFSFANFRLQNVQGGNLKMLINDQIALPTYSYYQGNTFQVSRDSDFFDTQDFDNVSGNDIFGRFDNVKLRTTNQYTSDCDASCASHCCSTSDLTDWDQSCMVMISPCDFDGGDSYFLAVETLSQDVYGEPINFEIAIDQYDGYDEIESNTNKIGHFTDGNYDQHYYVGRTDHQQSVRFRVQVINGDGVTVVVRDSNCPEESQWEQEIYCDARWINRAWQCDIEVPTRAAHPGAHINNFYVSVSGNNATYSIGYFSGRENCEQFSGSGISDGLRFCENLVTYSTFRHEKYFLLDDAARCLFEELYDHFRVSDCFSGVTPSCNQTLARFSCYEHFRRCDNDGFYVGTCKKACDSVEYECSQKFESVDLEAFSCTSSRYLDDRYETCTGHHEQYEYSGERFLGERVDDILFKSSPLTKTFTDVSTTALGSSVASTTSLSIFTIFFSVVFFFLM